MSKEIIDVVGEAIAHYAKLSKAGKNPLDVNRGTPEQAKMRKGLAVTDLSTLSVNVSKAAEFTEVVPTGIEEFDIASGIGGVPRNGKTIELFGVESGGKSWLAYKIIAAFQREGLIAGLLDLEDSASLPWLTGLDVNPEHLIYENGFRSGETWMQLTNDLCAGGYLDLLVVDSTAAVVPEAQINAPAGKQNVALLARLLSQEIPKVCGAAKSKEGKGGKATTVIWINQVREKPGVTWGNPEVTPGGKALKFYSDMRIDVRKKSITKQKVGEDEIPIAQISSGQFVKNKLAPPYRKFLVNINFDATLSNPLVMLVHHSYEKKLFAKYKGEYRFVPEDKKDKNVPTGEDNLVDLANWAYENSKTFELVSRVTQAYEDAVEDIPTFLGDIDEGVLPPPRVGENNAVTEEEVAAEEEAA
jgi:recombination protein RecA